MAPKDVHILILRTCEYGTLLDKRDFAGVTRLRRVSGRGDYPGLSGWPRGTTSVLARGRQEGQSRKRK